MSGISSTPQKYLKFKQPKKIFQFCTLTFKKTLNCIEMTLKLAQFCDDPPKNPQNLHTPKKYSFFWTPPPPPNIEIQKFEPKKIAQAYVWVKISDSPPPTHWGAGRTLNTPLIHTKTFSNNLLSDNKCRLPEF